MSRNLHVRTDPKSFNIELIHQQLTQSYWSKGIPISTVIKAIENSLCFAVFNDDKQIAFARMITDKATFAYLADVFVLEAYQGEGVGKYLIEHILSHQDLHGLRRTMLATRDAHGLYAQFGFKPIISPETFMEIWDPEIYQ